MHIVGIAGSIKSGVVYSNIYSGKEMTQMMRSRLPMENFWTKCVNLRMFLKALASRRGTELPFTCL